MSGESLDSFQSEEFIEKFKLPLYLIKKSKIMKKLCYLYFHAKNHIQALLL